MAKLFNGEPVDLPDLDHLPPEKGVTWEQGRHIVACLRKKGWTVRQDNAGTTMIVIVGSHPEGEKLIYITFWIPEQVASHRMIDTSKEYCDYCYQPLPEGQEHHCGSPACQKDYEDDQKVIEYLKRRRS